MNQEHQDNTTSSIHLAHLDRELTPPEGLEDQVVDDLRARGLLHQRSPKIRWPRILAHAAVLLVGLVAGLLVARDPQVADHRDRYLILLYETDQFNVEHLSHEQLAGEYAAWARELADEDLFSDGDSLASEGRLFSPDKGPADAPLQNQPTGFFMIRAETPQQAADIAADCPHLRHGGHLALRRMGGS